MSETEPRLSFRSAHLRTDAREPVVKALVRAGAAVSPIPVHPPRPLGEGLLVSPVRNGWVSLYLASEDGVDDGFEWLLDVTEAVDCPAVVFDCIESELWTAELMDAGQWLGRVSRPAAAWEQVLLAELVQEWQVSPDSATAAMEVRETPEFQSRLAEMRGSEPEPEAILRCGGRPAALALLDGPPPSGRADQQLREFAAELGIVDVDWDPEADLEALAEGDYEAESPDLPTGWSEFQFCPYSRLRMLA